MKINTRAKLFFVTVAWIAFVILSSVMFVKAYNFMKTSSLWRVNDIRIYGLKRISEDELLKLLNLPTGTSIWDVNLSRLENTLSKHQWIEKAIVKWHFPGVVSVTVVERYPVAVMCCDSCFYVDAQGKLFGRLDSKKPSHDDVPWFSFCPKDFQNPDSYVLSVEILNSFCMLIQSLRNVFGHSWKEMEVLYSQTEGFIINLKEVKAFVGISNISGNVEKLQYVMKKLETSGVIENYKEVDVRYARWVFIR